VNAPEADTNFSPHRKVVLFVPFGNRVSPSKRTKRTKIAAPYACARAEAISRYLTALPSATDCRSRLDLQRDYGARPLVIRIVDFANGRLRRK
jgi:hypothetical protein